MKKILLSIAMLALGAFLFNSCKKSEIKQEIIESQDQFHSVLRMNMGNVGSIPVGIGGPSGAPGQYGTTSFGEFQTIYLDIQNITPDVQAKIENVSSLQDISELVVNYGAIVEFANENANSDTRFNIRVQEARASLAPMVMEAKRYLLYRGFTEREIYEMIVVQGATEYDLVPLVIFLQEAAFVGDNPFMGCAAAAIGVDAVGGRLSRVAIEQIFNTSVSRVSGPVSAAIAVGNYMHCLVEEMDVIVETMLTSDEFEKMMDKHTSFTTMFLFERFEGTQRDIELENVETRDELMRWIESNMVYTLFTSVAHADQMLSALEKQATTVGDMFIPDRLEKDVELFEDRVQHLMNTPQRMEDWQIAVCAVAGAHLNARARAMRALRALKKGKAGMVYIGVGIILTLACATF